MRLRGAHAPAVGDSGGPSPRVSFLAPPRTNTVGQEATFTTVGFLALHLSIYRQGYADPAGPQSGSQGSLSGRTGGRMAFNEPMRASRCLSTLRDPADDRPHIQ